MRRQAVSGAQRRPIDAADTAQPTAAQDQAMELLLLMGLLAGLVLAAVATVSFLRQRREGTILVVSTQARSARRANRTDGRASSAHR
jgi:hypothetical protein